MTDTAKEVETITLPADPEALGRALVERYEVADLFTISDELSKALPRPQTMTEVLEEMHANWTPPPPPDPATFSEQQLEIVRRIHLHTDQSVWKSPLYKRLDKRAGDWESETMLARMAYPVWRIEDFVDGDITPAKRASASRALKRLEERGIVSRRWHPYGRKTHVVSLTSDGERLATRLTS